MLIGDQNISIHYPVFVRHFERPVKGDIVTILKGIDFFSFFSIFFFYQVPLHLIGKYFLKDYPNYGNVLVWVSIILGQPLAILCYFHDYYVSVGEVCITLIHKHSSVR